MFAHIRAYLSRAMFASISIDNNRRDVIEHYDSVKGLLSSE